MANNKIAYGLAKKHGIDTEGMTPKEVWAALDKKGVEVSGETDAGELTDFFDEKKKEPKVDEFFEKKGISVRMFEQNRTERIKSTDITKECAIMGYKTGRPIRASYGLSQKYGGNIEYWQKMRGETFLKADDGKTMRAEVHWYKNENRDFLECKFKRWLLNESKIEKQGRRQ